MRPYVTEREKIITAEVALRDGLRLRLQQVIDCTEIHIHEIDSAGHGDANAVSAVSFDVKCGKYKVLSLLYLSR